MNECKRLGARLLKVPMGMPMLWQQSAQSCYQVNKPAHSHSGFQLLKAAAWGAPSKLTSQLLFQS